MTRLVDPMLLSFAVFFASSASLADARSSEPAQLDAEPPELESDAPEGYYRAVDLGLDELERGNFEEARSRFLQAHRILPNARTLRALGKMEYELKHYKAAVRYLDEALGSEARPLTAELRADVKALRQKALEYIGTYTLKIEPETAIVRIDGSLVRFDHGSQLTLEVGLHILEAWAPHHQPAREELHVAGGEDRTLRLRLLPKPETSEAGATAGPRASASERPLRRRWWVWAGAGGLVAGAAVAGLLMGLRSSTETISPSGGNSELVVNVP